MEQQLQENVESLYPILTEILTEQVNPDLEILSDENELDLSSKQYAKVNKGTKFLIYIYDEQRQLLNIDDVLSLYLIDVAEGVIVNFYKSVACLIQLLRSCINEMGFETITGITPIEMQGKKDEIEIKAPKTLKELVQSKLEIKKNLFTQKKKAELIPQFANVFMQKYLPKKCNTFNMNHASIILEHLCMWLNNRKFTTCKLNLI